MNRIQLKRKAGWRLPPGYKKVDRSTRWGNMFRVVKVGDGWRVMLGNGYIGRPLPTKRLAAELAVSLFENALNDGLVADLDSLRGVEGLACWCKPGEPCHADAIIKHLERNRGE